MAKGRKLTTSRSERLLGSYGYGHSHGSTGTDSSELGEEDIWSMVDHNGTEREDQVANNSNGEWSPRASAESNDGNMSMVRSRRRIPRDDRHVGGLSLAFEESGKTASSRIVHQFRGNDSVASPRGHHMATSAPVNVPDWSKILRVESVESLHELDDGWDDQESDMVPPHEYLAREYARTGKATATSVFEGVGRTLKGRDLRRVRDAVWSQTGFDG
ncbi:hypothetical protein FNV43_RR07812 [Rhamnella rubrinervis]|uniref:Senescence regulator n=1 Tax=Rhamnella rubrinervis TaxID=2594499 RepID=A0A8K0MMI2_9ROSA|nr:hypothetical protein FNV43_RR07812 [Rhamnella rubrinervis]